MRKVNGWCDDADRRIQAGRMKVDQNRSRNLIRTSTSVRDILTIMSVGGCTRLSMGLSQVLERNRKCPPDLSEIYSKIVMIRDRDDEETERIFLDEIEGVLSQYDVHHTEELSNNQWLTCEMKTQMGIQTVFSVLLMIIPFGETGAMETFLLDAIGENDPYDKRIIENCRRFVDGVDLEKRYLTSRRFVTKAKFDTYFSIRTPVEQFVQRQNILKNVEWEKYTSIQKDFEMLSNI